MPEAHPTRRAGGALRYWLFGLYLAAYVAFTILTAFDRQLMASAPFGGANLAVLAGFGLIGAAIALALLYWWLARDAAGSALVAPKPEAKAE
jgi:uncharacterized membrane protein (DUF485 family)